MWWRNCVWRACWITGAGWRDPRPQADGDLEFVIAGERESGNGRAITVTQHDIRELQLAKGAIRCGIEALLRKRASRLATWTGSSLRARSARTSTSPARSPLACCPGCRGTRFSQVGNAGGTGARLALISRPHRQQAQEITERVSYLELARTPRFMRNFAEAMYL